MEVDSEGGITVKYKGQTDIVEVDPQTSEESGQYTFCRRPEG